MPGARTGPRRILSLPERSDHRIPSHPRFAKSTVWLRLDADGSCWYPMVRETVGGQSHRSYARGLGLRRTSPPRRWEALPTETLGLSMPKPYQEANTCNLLIFKGEDVQDAHAEPSKCAPCSDQVGTKVRTSVERAAQATSFTDASRGSRGIAHHRYVCSRPPPGCPSG
jgi:hypothetical protein